MIADMPQYNGESKDILIRQILEAVAEDNRREIIERLWKGRQERVRKGLFPGGNLPYGYVRTAETVKIDQREAEIVSRIFRSANQRFTGQSIASQLNREGFTRRNGKPWTQRQVCGIINREKLYKECLLHYGSVEDKNSSVAFLTQGHSGQTIVQQRGA